MVKIPLCWTTQSPGSPSAKTLSEMTQEKPPRKSHEALENHSPHAQAANMCIQLKWFFQPYCVYIYYIYIYDWFMLNPCLGCFTSPLCLSYVAMSVKAPQSQAVIPWASRSSWRQGSSASFLYFSWGKKQLVGGIPTPLKNMKVSWDDYSQYMEKWNSCSKPPTCNNVLNQKREKMLSCS